MPIGKLFRAVKTHEEKREAQWERKIEQMRTDSHDDSNWLISYADMMTLLCGFFIMLFSLAHLDEPKYEKLKESVAAQFGGKYQSPTEELGKYMNQVIQEAGIQKDVALVSDPAGVSLTFESTVFFDTLSSELYERGKVILLALGRAIAADQKTHAKTYRIVVEGHTDSRPIIGGNFPSNWELSSSRATRVIRLFIDQGFDPKLLAAVGYADTHPLLADRTPAGVWDENALSKNRRVVVRILQPKVDFIPLPQ